MARNIITGLDIGSSSIRAIVVEQKKTALCTYWRSPKRIRRGQKRLYHQPWRRFQNNFRDRKISGKNFWLIHKKRHCFRRRNQPRLLPLQGDGPNFQSRRRDYRPRHQKADRPKRSQSDQYGQQESDSLHPSLFKVDNALVQGRPTEMKGTKLEVETLLVTCLSQHLSDLIKTIESAGLSVDDIVASPLATSYSVLTKQQKETGRVMPISAPAPFPWLCLKTVCPYRWKSFPSALRTSPTTSLWACKSLWTKRRK